MQSKNLKIRLVVVVVKNRNHITMAAIAAIFALNTLPGGFGDLANSPP